MDLSYYEAPEYYDTLHRTQGSLQEIWTSLTSLYEDNLFLANFNEFLDLRPKLVKPSPSTPFPRPIKEGILLDRVNFHYPTGERVVLEDIILSCAQKAIFCSRRL